MSKNHGMGSIFSELDLRDYQAIATSREFPEEFKIKITQVKNQGSVGSCVAHSLSTVTEYFNKIETGRYLEMSTGYIYGNRLLSLNKGSGMITRDAIKTLSKFGNVPRIDFPENVEVPEAIDLFDANFESLEDIGVTFKIDKYFRLKDNNAMKAHLMDNNPIVFSMKWFDDIKIVDGVMVTDEVTSKETGGHCMVIYGWNKDGWLVQNSWGTRWGKSGRFVLPYSVSRKETWGVVDATSTSTLEIKKPFNSKFGSAVAEFIHKVIRWIYSTFKL